MNDDATMTTEADSTEPAAPLSSTLIVVIELASGDEMETEERQLDPREVVQVKMETEREETAREEAGPDASRQVTPAVASPVLPATTGEQAEVAPQAGGGNDGAVEPDRVQGSPEEAVKDAQSATGNATAGTAGESSNEEDNDDDEDDASSTE